MTNPDNVGGLPELPEPVMTAYTKKDGVTPFWKYDGMPMAHEGRREDSGTNKAIHLYTADQMRAYGELCRAAPAGSGEVEALVQKWRRDADVPASDHWDCGYQAACGAHADELEALLRKLHHENKGE